MLRVEKRLGHGVVSAGLDFRMKTRDLVFEIVGHRIQRHANGKIGGSAQGLARPVRPLIQSAKDFHKAHRIHFIYAAGFRVIAD